MAPLVLAFVVLTASCAEPAAPPIAVVELCGPPPSHALASIATTEEPDAVRAVYSCPDGFATALEQESVEYVCTREYPFWLAPAECTPSIWLDPDSGLEWELRAGAQTWNAATDACVDLTLDGAGWRLPTLRELLTIVDYVRDPATVSAFSGSLDGQFFASDPTPGDFAVGVDFTHGTLASLRKTESFGYRCVRGSELPGASWTSNGDGTATDAETGLTWEAMRSWSIAMTLADAQAHCASQTARGGGWRVPTLYDYHSIIVVAGGAPWLDGAVITDHPAIDFWTTTRRFGSGSTFAVDFMNMDFVFRSVTSLEAVRCVKD